jgi:hypothetical protein
LDAPSTMDDQDLMGAEPLCGHKRATALQHGGARTTVESSPEKVGLALQGSVFNTVFFYGAIAVWGAHLGGVASLPHWTNGAGTGSNGCGDNFLSSAWRCWSSRDGVAAQQWKGQRLWFGSDFARTQLDGSPIYRGFAPRSCATRIRLGRYLQSKFVPDFGWHLVDFRLAEEESYSVGSSRGR